MQGNGEALTEAYVAYGEGKTQPLTQQFAKRVSPTFNICMNMTLSQPVNDCLFCRLIAGDVPCTCVYEDGRTLAFLDIHPVRPGHVLVCLKKHVQSLLELSADDLGSLMTTIQKVALAVKVGLGASGFNLEQNDGSDAGQAIPHVHIHIIPRRAGDGLKHWPGQAYPNSQAAEEVAAQIRSGL